MNLNKLAKEIIDKNQYLALATTNGNKNLWISPVCYAYDKDFNFYFGSLPTSKHSVNGMKNKKVAFAIYDSTQKWGYGVGLQIEGTLEEVKLTQMPRAMKIYLTRNYPYGNITGAFAKGFKELLNKKIYRFYKLTPIKIWMNNPEADVDERVEVKP